MITKIVTLSLAACWIVPLSLKNRKKMGRLIKRLSKNIKQKKKKLTKRKY